MKSFLFLLIYTFYSSFLLAQDKPIKIFYKKSDEGFVFYANNNESVPYTVKIDFQKMENLSSSSGEKSFIRTIPANAASQEVLKLKKNEETKGTSFDFNFLYNIGDPSLTIDEDYPYLLPYKHGKRVRIGQGNNGSGTHRGVNAIDFNLEIGDSIYAARNGLVIEVSEDSNVGGNDPKFEKYGNFIKVYHDDGTVGSYVHLQKNGSLVEKGDKIEKGQFIGLSGNTGWSSGPHLHFMVAKNQNFKNITLPIKFLNYKEELFIPRESNSYYAYHPEKPDFEVQDSFQESQFEAEMKPSDLNNKIKFDTENYGDYVLIYVNNGMNTEMRGILKLELKNLISTKKLPYKFTVPAKTKMYLLALSPDNSADSFGYQLSGEFN
ncbi:M23 family metallopeptidase [Marivirga salinae]|uniref:M23 family metallopeptidase n=1 Tax=Marivirga salinarum TaxID=3059078 RepID=A0AA51NAM6_9BACT|nr:M23 family metallopeptidase [Marivirga sp. BDSF4-3]WMN11901.1 M23 family metallopeptidase [Marivirga sp. BDSF4-3]